MNEQKIAAAEKRSQKMKILEYLKEGGELTALKALTLFGCLRLGARIWDIKKMGYEIQRDWIETADGARVAVYKMSVEEVKA